MDEKSILIVDDDSFLLKLIGSYLQKSDSQLQPLFATTVEEAKNILIKHNIRLLVTDLVIEDGSGMDLISYAQERSANIRSFIQSSHVDKLKDYLPHSAHLFLSKPYLPSSFIDRVNQSLAADQGSAYRFRLIDFLFLAEFLDHTCQFRLKQDNQVVGSVELFRGRVSNVTYESFRDLEALYQIVDQDSLDLQYQSIVYNASPAQNLNLDVSEVLYGHMQKGERLANAHAGGSLNSPEAPSSLSKVKSFVSEAELLCNQVAKEMRGEAGFVNFALFDDSHRLVRLWSQSDKARDERLISRLMSGLAAFTHVVDGLEFGSGSQMVYYGSDNILIATFSAPESPHDFTLLLNINQSNRYGFFRLKMESLANNLNQLPA